MERRKLENSNIFSSDFNSISFVRNRSAVDILQHRSNAEVAGKRNPDHLDNYDLNIKRVTYIHFNLKERSQDCINQLQEIMSFSETASRKAIKG